MSGSAGRTQESSLQGWAGRENNWSLKIRGLKDCILIGSGCGQKSKVVLNHRYKAIA